MNFRKIWQSALRILGFAVLSHAVDLLYKSLKIIYINKNIVEELEKQNKNFVLVFWHSTMLLPWFIHRNKQFAALTSKSKDGELLAKILKHWNYAVVRGSSNEGGNIALGIMVDYAKNGKSIALTPDGPRGPEFKMKAGAVVTAKKSGVPLVLLGAGYEKKRILNSWDKFQIPKFFSQTKAIYAGPFYIDANLDFNGTNDHIIQYEKILNQIQKEAETFNC